ncbi:unnamed protein product [Trichobilharzia szidati]|nr:unnamed protein product [Trichobilharzia szidati]
MSWHCSGLSSTFSHLHTHAFKSAWSGSALLAAFSSIPWLYALILDVLCVQTLLLCPIQYGNKYFNIQIATVIVWKGYIIDLTQSHNPAFIISGLGMVLSAFSVIPVIVQRFRRKRARRLRRLQQNCTEPILEVKK